MQYNIKNKIIIHSPAKLNLFLAINSFRNDLYHNLLSLSALTNFGDTLTISTTKLKNDQIICNKDDLIIDSDNLILRAIQEYRKFFFFPEGVTVNLIKRIPIGGGLGGGSSNAIATLLGLNKMHNFPLTESTLFIIASRIGSDCSLFLRGKTVIIEGRGEITRSINLCLNNFSIILFKPFFGIKTSIAFEMMRNNSHSYLTKEIATKYLLDLLKIMNKNSIFNKKAFYNSFEDIISIKYPIIKVMLNSIRREFDLPCGMSGSGSTCFLIYNKKFKLINQIKSFIRNIIGVDAFIVETNFL